MSEDYPKWFEKIPNADLTGAEVYHTVVDRGFSVAETAKLRGITEQAVIATLLRFYKKYPSLEPSPKDFEDQVKSEDLQEIFGSDEDFQGFQIRQKKTL